MRWIVLASVLAGCSRTAPAPDAAPAAPAPAATTPHADLAAMDPRKPVPLQPMMAWHQKQNMMQHLVDVQGVVDALAREDWGAVAQAAKGLESSPEMAQRCQHMGAGAPGFTDLALDFHQRADGIGVAAQAQDGAGVLRALSSTLQACTGCHAAYRQEVVDAETWMERAAAVGHPP